MSSRIYLLKLHRKIHQIEGIDYKQSLEYHPDFPNKTARGVSDKVIINDIQSRIDNYGDYLNDDENEEMKERFKVCFEKFLIKNYP